jgi:long-chain acyl-CoA synthetase
VITRLKYWSAVTLFNAFPLPRLSGFRKSFAFAGEVMDRGFNVLIFPEGELTKDGKIASFRSGVGLLADGLECPVLPVRIAGLWELKEQGRRYYAPPGSVTITFGKPLYFQRDESPADFARRLREIIAK